ncbi:MAG: NAD(P)-binding domain-containing protein [Duodenibacillus massiliensis]
MNTAFIGGGNMAGAMIAGMHAKGVNGETIWISDPHLEKREKLHALYGAVGFEGRESGLKRRTLWCLP